MCAITFGSEQLFITVGYLHISLHVQQSAYTLHYYSDHTSIFPVQFHLGNIYHLQGHYIAAKETYEGILAKKNVANSIKAMALRQLGKQLFFFQEVLVNSKV